MKFLQNLLPGRSAISNPAGATTRATGGNYGGLLSLSPGMDTERQQQSYERVMWVFRCVDSIATKTSHLPIKFRQGGRTDDYPDVDELDLDRILNREGNSYETGSSLRYRISTLALISPKGVFLEKVRSKSGGLAQLHVLNPGNVTPIKDPQNYVAGYMVQNGVDGQDFLKPEQVLWIKLKPHPTNPYLQMTPLMSAGIVADTDLLARTFNLNFLRNDGRPGMLITVEDLLPGDADILRERFGGGVNTAGAATIIEGKGIDIADMSTSPRDAMWTESLANARDDILAAFGVPMIAFGSSNEKTFDNADAESVSYWTETLVPHMNKLAEAYDYLTPGGVNDNIYVVHDTTTIHSLQEAYRARKTEMLAEVAAGVRTINSYREETGEEPFDFPEARVLWLNQALVPAGDPADLKLIQKNAPPAPAMGGGGMPGQRPPDALPPTKREAAQLHRQIQGAGPRQQTLRQLAQASSASSLRAIANSGPGRPRQVSNWIKRPRGHKAPGGSEAVQTKDTRQTEHPYMSRRLEIEANIAGAITSWSDRQLRTAIERLGGTKVRKGTRHWDGPTALEVKKLDAHYIAQPDRWVSDLTQVLQSVLRDVVEEETAQMASDYGLDSAGWDVSQLMNILGDMAIRKAIEQTGVVELMIQEGDDRGKNILQIRQALEELGHNLRSWIKPFAVTITTAAIEGARSLVAERIGRMTKTWRSYGDDKVRDAHRALNGRTVQVRNPFTIGGVKIRYPGDPLAPIGLTINCRCWLDIVPEGGALA